MQSVDDAVVLFREEDVGGEEGAPGAGGGGSVGGVREEGEEGWEDIGELRICAEDEGAEDAEGDTEGYWVEGIW